MDSKNTVRVILNVPVELNDSFVDLARKRGLTKSNMIIYCMSWFLDYSKSIDLMPKMIDVLMDFQKPNSFDDLDKFNK